MDLSETLLKLKNRDSLTSSEMEKSLRAIMSGAVPTPSIEEFLVGLRQKGESVEEIVSAARVMREHAVKLSRKYEDLLDTCGTGGDAKNTLNISTLSAITACAAGARVAKHGNRSVSSLCGSADLLEMLGVRIDLTPDAVERCIEETHFGFFFAPLFHPATKAAMPARRNIEGKTIFNLLGPLSNPAGADFQLVGVYDKTLVETVAQALMRLGTRRAMVVHGLDGLDEISLSGPTQVAELQNGSIRVYLIHPEDFGLKIVPLKTFQCFSKEDNKESALKILRGKPGPQSDIVCLNAGAALYVAGQAPTIQEGFLEAQKALHSQQAAEKLEEIVEFTQEA